MLLMVRFYLRAIPGSSFFRVAPIYAAFEPSIVVRLTAVIMSDLDLGRPPFPRFWLVDLGDDDDLHPPTPVGLLFLRLPPRRDTRPEFSAVASLFSAFDGLLRHLIFWLSSAPGTGFSLPSRICPYGSSGTLFPCSL